MAQNKEAPCKADIEKLCSSIKGKKQIRARLRENKSNLSKECTTKFKDAKEALLDCKEDMKKLCKGVKKGKGLMLKCLKDNSTELSPACKERVDNK